MLKEIRARSEKDMQIIKKGMYPVNTKQVFKDRAELLKLVDEAKKHMENLVRIQEPLWEEDREKAIEFLSKLD